MAVEVLRGLLDSQAGERLSQADERLSQPVNDGRTPG
jgi:hypothetical protein